MSSFSTDCFALVLVRHSDTGKYGVVDESGKRGLWISGGFVDPGETFQTAAVREAKEELGCDVRLTGIIRVEHSLTGKRHARMRVIFTGEPVDPSAPLKSVPDHESDAGYWMTRPELEEAASKGRLRGLDFLEFVRYVDDGKPVHPLSLLADEGSPMAS